MIAGQSHDSEAQDISADWISTNELRAALNENVRDSLPPAALAAAGLYAFFAVNHWLVLPHAIAVPLVAFAVPTAISFFLIWTVLRRKLVPLQRVHPIGAAMVALVLMNTLLQLRISGDVKQSTNVMLLIVATGAFLLGRNWLVLCLLLTIFAWVAVAEGMQLPYRLHYGFAMFSASVLSVLIHLVRVKSILRLESLRKKEQGLRLTAELAIEATMTSEKRYRELVENSPGFIFTHDLSGRILSVNPAAADALGFSPNEVVGSHLFDFAAELDQSDFESYLQVIREKRTVEGYLRLVAKNGEDRTWYYRNFHYEEPGRAPYVIGHAEDISGILRGILPICASCKRIRNQRGDWEQVEAYIREHTEAEFSHGICPECRNRLYPGFDSPTRSAE
jgi:PAS domain S-box-containing protein